jgi:hypothetical protein
MLPVISWTPICYASSAAFDAVVLLLTLVKLCKNFSKTKAKLWQQLYRDNLVYFILTAVTNITVLSIQALGPSHDMLKPMATPFSILMAVTMGSRVFLNLKPFEQKLQEQTAGKVPGIQPVRRSIHETNGNRASPGVGEFTGRSNRLQQGYVI